MEGPNIVIEEEEGIDIRKWFFHILDNWLLFVVFIFMAISIAFVYNKIAINEYQLSTSILIKENPDPLDKSNLLRVSLYSDPYRLDNEIGIISSSSVKKQTLKSLDFFVEYYKEESFKSYELYHNSPFLIEFDSSHSQPVNMQFSVSYLNDSLVVISAEGESISLYNYSTFGTKGVLQTINFSDTVHLGDTVESNILKFRLTSDYRGIKPEYKNFKYSFYFRSMSYLLKRYGDIKINIPNGSSIMTLEMKHPNPEKAAVYLNELIDNYLLKGIERENKIAQRTINFIDNQLGTLVDSLKISEQKLEDFRSANRLVNLDYQAQQAYLRQSELDKQNTELTMQKRYLEYLNKNLSRDTLEIDKLIAPSTMGLNDAVLNNLVMELVEMYSEKTELSVNAKKDNPYTASLNLKIESLKGKLRETVQNLSEATSLSISEINSQSGEVHQRLSQLPKDQRELLSFERKFQLNDELYTYLLTRRSEMQIKKASNIPSNEILEIAESSEAIKVHPNKRVNYIIALIMGLLLPFGIVYLRVLLNTKIKSQDDIKAVTRLPIVGTVFENDALDIPAIFHAPNSIIAESFRMLRANMQFITGEDKSPIIIMSSAMQGEGKSYTAINYAAACATYNKKVLLIDLDLRRPKLAKYMKVNSDKGMSNYLIGKAKIDEIIYPVCDGLFDIITSGPIPPNPSELVASNNLDIILKKLKENYDIIILDTPPIGMVSDALFLSKSVGYLLLVVRHGKTHKHLLSILIEELQRNEISGLNLIYNDVPSGKKGYYRYGSRYGYYYTNNKKSFWSGLLNKNNKNVEDA